MEKVSIVIPTFNRSSSVKKAVESVLNQTYQNFELIIVDDNSNDDTRETISILKDRRIRYHRNKKNLGGSASRNVGINMASSKFIAFLDDDDEWLPEKLEKQIHILEKTKSDFCGVFTGFKYLKEGKVIKRTIPQKEGDLYRDLLWSNCIGTTSIFLVKKSCLSEIGNFNEKLPASQDWDLYLRLARKYKFKVIQEPLVNYCVHEGEQISDSYQKKLASLEYMYENNKNEIVKFKKIHGNHLYNLSIFELLNSNRENALNYVKKSVEINPLNIKYWGLLFLIKFYPNFYFKIGGLDRQYNIFKK